MFTHTSYSICAEVSRSSFRISADDLSGPGALLFFCFLMALLISPMVALTYLVFRPNAGASGMSATSSGGSRFRRLLKYSTHLIIRSCRLVSLLPKASLMGLDGGYRFPASFHVVVEVLHPVLFCCSISFLCKVIDKSTFATPDIRALPHVI